MIDSSRGNSPVPGSPQGEKEKKENANYSQGEIGLPTQSNQLDELLNVLKLDE